MLSLQSNNELISEDVRMFDYDVSIIGCFSFADEM